MNQDHPIVEKINSFGFYLLDEEKDVVGFEEFTEEEQVVEDSNGTVTTREVRKGRLYFDDGETTIEMKIKNIESMIERAEKYE